MSEDLESNGVEGGESLRHRMIAGFARVTAGRFRLTTMRYRVALPGWPMGAPALRILVIADVHACEPWMPLDRITAIVDAGNRLHPDITLLAGDFAAGMRRYKVRDVEPVDWAWALAGSMAPLGAYAVLGNHDWEHDGDACRAALEQQGIQVLENDAVRLTSPAGTPFWLAGLGCQYAYPAGRTFLDWRGRHDLPRMLAQIKGDEPVILLAHEPDIFPDLPDRIGLTIAGHTHGGQVCLPFVGALRVPSRYGRRYAYGHIREGEKQMIVSAGLGYSLAPVRLFRPPELVIIEAGGAA